MRTYKQQRREFVLLAMKLIEKNSWYQLIINNGEAFFYQGLIRFTCPNKFNEQQNEQEIQKLKDLLEESK